MKRQMPLIIWTVIVAFRTVKLQILQSSTISTTSTTSRCTPLPPDYAVRCNTTNSFTLPNGRFVDQYVKFCACTPEHIRNHCTDIILDIPQRECNADGTYNCITAYFGIDHCTTDPGKPFTFPFAPFGSIPCTPKCSTICASEGRFCQPACIRYSKDLQRFQNVGECSCTLARSQQVDTTLFANDNYVPQCSGDGSWQKLQTGYGGAWCVDSAGNPTGDVSFDSVQPPSCY